MTRICVWFVFVIGFAFFISPTNSQSTNSKPNERNNNIIRFFNNRDLNGELKFAITSNWPIDREQLFHPNDAVEAAAQDVENLAKIFPVSILRHIRYITVYNYPLELRHKAYSIVSFCLNSLNTKSSIITKPAIGGPGNILIRINLLDYNIDPKVWDSLGSKDPYFHQEVELVESDVVTKIKKEVETKIIKEYLPDKFELITLNELFTSEARFKLIKSPGQKVFVDRKQITQDSFHTPPLERNKLFKYTITVEDTVLNEKKSQNIEFKGGFEYQLNVARLQDKIENEIIDSTNIISENVNKKKRIVLASWLNPAAVTKLITTLNTETPILRADNFIFQAMQSPKYYEFIGVKNIEDYLKLVGFDKGIVFKEYWANIDYSGSVSNRVAANNRLVARFSTSYGFVWRTADFVNNKKENNVVKNPLMLNLLDPNKQIKPAAGEWIGTTLNGLHIYALTDGNDNLINEGVIELVGDSNFPDYRVINSRSCIVCHVNGINKFESSIQKLLKNNDEPLFVSTLHNDPNKAFALYQTLKEKFLYPDWEEIVNKDIDDYNKIVIKASGVSAKILKANFLDLWLAYQFKKVDHKTIAFETGIRPEGFKKVLKAKLNGLADPILLMLLPDDSEISRDYWEEAFPEFMMRLGVLNDTLKLPNVNMKNIKK